MSSTPHGMSRDAAAAPGTMDKSARRSTLGADRGGRREKMGASGSNWSSSSSPSLPSSSVATGSTGVLVRPLWIRMAVTGCCRAVGSVDALSRPTLPAVASGWRAVTDMPPDAAAWVPDLLPAAAIAAADLVGDNSFRDGSSKRCASPWAIRSSQYSRSASADAFSALPWLNDSAYRRSNTDGGGASVSAGGVATTGGCAPPLEARWRLGDAPDRLPLDAALRAVRAGSTMPGLEDFRAGDITPDARRERCWTSSCTSTCDMCNGWLPWRCCLSNQPSSAPSMLARLGAASMGRRGTGISVGLGGSGVGGPDGSAAATESASLCRRALWVGVLSRDLRSRRWRSMLAMLCCRRACSVKLDTFSGSSSDRSSRDTSSRVLPTAASDTMLSPIAGVYAWGVPAKATECDTGNVGRLVYESAWEPATEPPAEPTWDV